MYLVCFFIRQKLNTITNVYQYFLVELKSEKRKPNKIWVDKDSEFYNK